MTIRTVFEKVLNNQRISEDERQEFLYWADQQEATAYTPTAAETQGFNVVETASMVVDMLASRGMLPKLSDITRHVGLLQGGEFRVGNDNAPGDGFTGGRFGYPGFLYDSVEWFLAGVENDVLKTGLNISDGKLYAEEATISGTLTAAAGSIGGWDITSSAIRKLSANVGIVLDSSTPKIQIGDTAGNHIVIDGANQRIRSSNFATGAAGFNIAADTGDAEFNNIVARGMIKTSVFQKNTISSVGGQMLVLDSDTLASDMTALDASTLTISGNTTFAVGDILRMKSGAGTDEWLEVTNIGSAPTYTVTRDKAAAYSANNNPAWKKGQAVVNYGASGSGGVELVAGADPAMKVFNHAGSPWTALSEIIKMHEGGIVLANVSGVITFLTIAGDEGTFLFNEGTDDFAIQNNTPGKAVRTYVTLTNDNGPYTELLEDPDNVNVALFNVNADNTIPTRFTMANAGTTNVGVSIWANSDGKETVFNKNSYDIDFDIYDAGSNRIFHVDAFDGLISILGDLTVDGNLALASGSTIQIGDVDILKGWISPGHTWTRTGNYTFTIVSDVTTTYRKGTKVRYKDGGSFEYGVVYSSSHAAGTTTVTLFTNDNYAMAAATITDNYISYIENPEAWPDWFDYANTITYGATAPMTISASSTTFAKFKVSDRTVSVEMAAVVTTATTASATVTASAPCAVGDGNNHLLVCNVRDAGAGSQTVGTGFISSSTINFRRFDAANWSLGASRVISAAGSYPF